MKLATLIYHDEQLVSVVDEAKQSFRPISYQGESLSDMNQFIARFSTIGDLLEYGSECSLQEATLLAPIPKPRRNIMCVGKNYLAHAREFTRSGFDSSAGSAADSVPQHPIIFTKMPESVVATNTHIGYPENGSSQLDYEAELGVIVGKPGRNIKQKSALDHVFGYVIINDLTARDLQAKHKQWFLGKSFETSCPMGPWLVTADELDCSNIDVKCWVNDELRQDANTRDMIFDIPTLIETLSRGAELLPGDVIATGTPVGVGIGFKPPRFLKTGDRVDITISGIGTLSNVVR